MESILTPQNSRKTTASAYRWANQVTSLGIELVIPIAGGWWIDTKYGLSPWLTVCGVLLGAVLGTLGLSKLIRDLDR